MKAQNFFKSTSNIVVSLMAVFLLICVQSCTPTLSLNRLSGPVELNTNVDLRAQPMGFKASEGPVEILWYVNGNQVATGENYLFSTTETGQYVVRAEAAQGVNKAQAQITLDAGPITPPPPPPSKFTPAQLAMLKKCIGKGYRAELDYADIGDVSLPLFDPEKLTDFTNIQLTGTYDESIVEGSTIKDYSNKLSASVGISGSVGLFSASVSTSFNSEGYESSENSFYTLKKVYHYYRLDLDPERAPLLPQVKNDIDNLPPNQLFDKYGTHFIKSAFIGARVVLNTFINKSEYSNETNFSASLKASYGAVSGDASVSTDNKESTKKFSSNSRLQIEGGDPLLSGNIINGIGNKKQNYDAWVASTKVVDGHTLADFGYQGMQPISLLASTPARQAALEKAINEYLASKGTPLPVPKTIVEKGSFFGLQSADSRWVSIPLFKNFIIGQVYYPLVIGTNNVAGVFTFVPSSSEKLMHGTNVNIRFVTDKLYPYWNEGKMDEEKNSDFLKKNFLKVGGGMVPHAHYWDNSSDCNWIIQKVGGKNGDPIFNNDEVYIYHQNQKKYLTMWNVGGTGLGVDELKDADKGSNDQEFKWKIRLANRN